MSYQEGVREGSNFKGIVILSTLAVGYLISTVVYRLYLHPLAKYPGPFWAKITSFPSYWHALKQDRHLWLFQLQEEFGSTFRYAPNSILINTPNAFKAIYGPKGNVKKGVFYLVWPRNVDTLTTLNVIDTEIHGRKRRVLNHSFSDRALRSAEQFVLSNTDRWCELIEDQAAPAGGEAWSSSLNMTDWANYLVFDILGDLCFGRQFNMKEPESDLRYVIHLITGFVEILHPIAMSPFAGFWAWMKPRGLDCVLQFASPPALKKWEAFVEDCIADRTKVEQEREHQLQAGLVPEGEERKDFFHYLFHAEDPETGTRGFPPHEMYGEAELLIIAGSDTTSIVMSSLLFYLTRHPAIQTKLANEIRSTFSTASEIKSGPKLQSCEYLRAFIQEGLRMTPPVGSETLREVREGGTDVDGTFFPPGVNVSVAYYCLSYNKDVYPEPFKFRPERWIVDDNEGSTEDSVALAESGACAFSMGSRGCPGKYLAWIEMSIVMAKLIYMFDMRQDPGNPLGGGDPRLGRGRQNVDLYQTYDVFVSLRDGPMIQFKRRE
ncbi:hypothetical protein N8I77_009707 [Diaporthe amygdali]|uniref:Uncharacterized protein n=1 Tax=Phomopsis amygdali TaxID=1214568 RepID=A0AAD9SA29_PHOAM|nr:hypothetical protein N8I77_009707 [Diaporthe amygdali]